ncbi:MFS monosaccharide transporter-like protein [Lophiostoma macrostomum CBS 122681]|uniref:MFS monosaccharide transporter-like protein n=1 Tax=Lophiostoma macrostomum CBS 122681 TaxID=1314788 RepID=A0A6A6SXL8_9PLEO|nr:MFS monosaccharide transporter-like protein [Lophiostoma macrostomum CBS 122681]
MTGNDDASMDAYASRGPAVLAVTAATLVACTVFVVLRLISRFAIVRKPGYDDYFMILAWLLAFGTSFSICYGTAVGLGRHEENVLPEWETPMKKSAYVFSVLYNPALMATKTSILMFYLTLSQTQKIFRWATIATLVVVNAGGLGMMFSNVFQCTPVAAAWATPVPDSASCSNIVTIYLSSAPLNIITDLAILFLPMPILTSMRLPKKQKTILVITFGFGVFVAVVDVVRIAYLQSAARTNLQNAQQHHDGDGTDSRNVNDFSWYASLSFMWSAIEINVGIMCACVPALKPVISRFLPQWIHDHTMREKTGTHTSDSIILNQNVMASQRRPTVPDAPVSPLTRPPVAHTDGHGDGDMDIMGFLTTPDMDEMAHLQQTTTFATYATTHRQPMTFFDFVDMSKKKNITLMSNRQSIYPIFMVTILFFIWGFAYGLLDTLNSRFQEVANMTGGQTVGQHSAYYLGYIVGPLTFGRLVLRHWGFKACYTVGLCTYACGALVFWPSAVLTSFPAFLISNFITGLGLSTLEVSANPFIALCGPPEYAEVRLNFSQAIQAIGSILSPLLAKKVLFKAEAGSLIDVQWAYLGISFFTVILAIVYYYVPLPEATDEELEDASARLPIPREATIGKNVKVIWVTLALGAFSQFCYVGGQEATGTSFSEYLHYVMPSLDYVSHQAVGHTAFATSRFLAAVANIWIKPRYVLSFFYLGAIAFAAACMTGHGASPAACIVMLMFFEGPLFPLIFVQPLRGMGKHTKDASVILTAAIGGGAVFPPIMYGAMQARNVQYAFCVVVAAYAAGTVFLVWLNTYPAARRLSDPVKDEQTRRESKEEEERRDSQQTGVKKKRFSHIRKRFSKEKDDLPWVEHRERRSWPEGQSPEASPRSSKGKESAASPTFETTPAWVTASPETSPTRKRQDASPTFDTIPEWLSEGADGHAGRS